jgi:hypothetical protein
MLELLAGRGMDCRVLSAGVLDHERETSLDEVLAALELPARRFEAELGTGRAAEVIDLSVNGVRVTLMPTASSRAKRSPDPRQAAVFLELAELVFGRFRPDVLLTYGGHPASLELMRRARLRGIAVVFHLHRGGKKRAKKGMSLNSTSLIPKPHASSVYVPVPETPSPQNSQYQSCPFFPSQSAKADLTLHPEKTKIVDAKKDAFDFLGYRFVRGQRYPRPKSMQKLKDAIRAKTKRTSGESLTKIINDLTPRLRGWFEYFKHSHRFTFNLLDGWIRMRLRSLLRKRLGKKGRGRGGDHQRWPNKFFAERGLYSLKTAYELVCQSSSR